MVAYDRDVRRVLVMTFIDNPGIAHNGSCCPQANMARVSSFQHLIAVHLGLF